MATRAERLREFLRRLNAAAPARSFEQAFELISTTLNSVEDELTEIPFDPPAWETDGRMYPPQSDNERHVGGRSDVILYRSRKHYIWIGINGAIRIEEVNGICVMDKKGLDGQPGLPKPKQPAALTTLVEHIQARLPDAKITVDAPADPAAEWWVDIACGKFQSTIAWRPAIGFGIFTSDSEYETRPDEIYRRGEMAVQRLEQLYEQWSTSRTIAPMWLTDVRKLVGTQQTTLASALNCNQPAVSRFEKREDIKLSSLAAYIEAMGGRLEVRVRFPEWDATIALPSTTG